MKRFIVLGIMLLAFGSTAIAGAVIDTGMLLHGLYDLGALPILTDSNCRQFSSFERTDGNRDWGNYLSRTEDGTAVLAEMKGPGAIVRIWSANPGGFLKIFLDGSPEPVIAMPFQEFFTDPNLQPIRTTSSGGWISYYPIPYAKSCRVIVEKAPNFYYHVTYQTYRIGTQVITYTIELDSTAKKELQTALSAWKTPADQRKPKQEETFGTLKGDFNIRTDKRINPGKTVQLFRKDGIGCLDEITVRADTSDPSALRKCMIRMYWDGEKSPSVEAPLLDFIGNGFEVSNYQALPLGIGTDGALYCHFPMPFGTSARIEIENGGTKPLGVKMGISGRELKSLPADVGRFHAKWHRESTKSGEPYLILQAKGKGKFVGVSMSMQGYGGLGFLEGDELIYVDCEKQPSFNGTGTEDYFNCGWYFSGGAIWQPMHGAPVRNDLGSRIAAYRFHIPDYIGFQKELTVKIEHGGTSDYPGADYSSVAYYYNAEPHLDFFEMPAAKDIRIPRRMVSQFIPPPPKDYTGCCIIDPKAAKLEARDGNARITSWGAINDGLREGDLVVFNRTGGAKPALGVPFKVEFGDRYSFSVYMAQGKGFGTVTAEVDGKRLPNSPDLSSEEEPMPKLVEFGDVALDPGDHVLTIAPIETKGVWPMVGLDRITLASRSAFITTWNVIGPFDCPKGTDLDTPYPPETEPFNPAAKYTGKNGQQVGWKEVSGKDIIYLQDIMTPNTDAVAYALTHIVSPNERKTELLLGSDDSVKVWLNGKEIWKNKIDRGAVPDNDNVVVTLKSGVNTLLFKIAQGGSRWGYVARLRDPRGELRAER